MRAKDAVLKLLETLPVARDDLKAIVLSIRADAPAYAKSFALRLHQRVTQLETSPDSGRLVPEDPTGTHRELIFGNYRIIYRHAGMTVTIVTVIPALGSSGCSSCRAASWHWVDTRVLAPTRHQ